MAAGWLRVIFLLVVSQIGSRSRFHSAGLIAGRKGFCCPATSTEITLLWNLRREIVGNGFLWFYSVRKPTVLSSVGNSGQCVSYWTNYYRKERYTQQSQWLVAFHYYSWLTCNPYLYCPITKELRNRDNTNQINCSEIEKISIKEDKGSDPGSRTGVWVIHGALHKR